MRKSTILIALFLLVLQVANAQNQKGDQTLGVGLGFSANNGNYNYQSFNPGSTTVLTNTNSTGFSAHPGYSYFIANNIDVGVSTGFGNGASSYNDVTGNVLSKQVIKTYFGSVYLRRYFLYNNKIGIRTGPYFSYQYSDSNTTVTPNNNQSDYNSKGKYYQAGLAADFVYYPSHKIGLAVNVCNLSANSNKYSSQQQSSSSNGIYFQFLNNNLMLSAFYVFGN